MSELSGTLSHDSHGRTSDAVAFRNGNVLTPISVTATAQLIPSSAWRNSMKMVNKGANVVYYGFDSTVTSTDGIEIAVNGAEGLSVGSGVGVWVVCAAAQTSTLRVAELG